MPTVLIYGDSNTHGTAPAPDLFTSARLPKADRWVTVVRNQLGAGIDVIDEGMPGRTTVLDDPISGEHYNGMRVLPAILHSHATIDLLVVMLGTNDIQTKYGFRTHEVVGALMKYIEVARNSGSVNDILIVAPVPVREVGTYADSYAGAEARQVGMACKIKAMTDHTGVGFFDAGQVAQVSEIDGVHFDAETQHKLGLAMADAISARLNG